MDRPMGVLRVPVPLSRWQWVAFAAIVVVAGIVRFAWLGSIPPGLWYDEALYALDGYRVSQGYFAWFFDEHGHPREPLFPWMLGAAFALLEPTVLVARCVSAAWGTVAVAVFLPVARRFCPPGWALAAVAAFAVFRWHIHFSRTIFRAGLSAPMALLTIWMFLRWRERRRPMDAILCGASAGVCLYTYISLRIMPVLLGVWLVCLLWTGAVRLRTAWRQVALMFATTAVVFLPLGIDYLQNPSHLSERTGEITMFEKDIEVVTADGTVETVRVRKSVAEALAGIGENAWGVALVWFVRGDYVARHGIPYEPVFDVMTGVVFFLGMGLVVVSLVRCFRRGRGDEAVDGSGALGPIILLTWFGGFAAASVFSFGAPNILRMQGAAPAAILLMIGGLMWGVERLPGAVTPRVRYLVAGLVLGVFAVTQLNGYFRIFPADLRVRGGFGADFFHAPAAAADALAAEVDVVYIPEEFLGSLQVRFLTIRRDNVVGYGPDGPLPVPEDGRDDVAWLVTARSVQLAEAAGQDQLGQLRAVAGVEHAGAFTLPVADEEGRMMGNQPWADLYVRRGSDGS